MVEILHVGALGASAVGVCCVALDGPRPRVREALLGLVMAAAMLDSVLSGADGGVLPAAAWGAITVALSLALAVRRRRSPEPARVTVMRAHAAVGGILMAALMLAMSARPAQVEAHHGAAPIALGAILLAAVAGYAVSAGLRLRSAHVLERVQYATMALSLVALGVALVWGAA